MRLILLLFPFFLSPVIALGQGGEVRYSHTFKILYPQDAASAVMEIVSQQEGEDYTEGPGYTTVPRTLRFNPEQSLMYPSEFDSSGVGNRPHIEYVDTTFVDLEKRSYSQWVDFYADAYLIKDHLPEISWRLTDEARKYLDYRVLKATVLFDSSIVEAWFSPDIPVPAGPGLYNGLPGLILMVTHADRGEVYAAESIDLGEPTSLTAPSTGREVSTERYNEIKASQLARSKRIYDMLMREQR